MPIATDLNRSLQLNPIGALQRTGIKSQLHRKKHPLQPRHMGKTGMVITKKFEFIRSFAMPKLFKELSAKELTDKQLRIAQMLSDGLTAEEIAELRKRLVQTIKNHTKKAFERIHKKLKHRSASNA